MEEFSEETLAKARTAKIYIEHLYRVQSQNVKERRDRCAPAPVVASAECTPAANGPTTPCCTAGAPSWSRSCRLTP
jgi:hypothetical protein